MYQKKRSFFERLTGTVSIDDTHFDDYDDAPEDPSWKEEKKDEWLDKVDSGEGQLALDMYQTEEALVIETMVAGVRPEDLEISITREMVTIKGHRETPRVDDRDWFHQELYWGEFSRSIVLPQEIEVEEAEATESYGMLTITLPKVNRAKETRLSVKSRS